MYIKSVTLENVKSFQGKHRFELNSGVNYFAGDNNSGKSTVMEALLFLFEGPSANKWTPEKFYSSQATGATRVEVDIADDIDMLVKQDKFKVLSEFVFQVGGQRILRLERSSELRTVTQGGKSKNIDVKAVCFWHPGRKQFENVTGIDARVKAIFDFEAIWADAHPGDHIDFANTKTLGRLLDSSFKRFTSTESWKALEEAHKKAFSADEEGSFLVETQRLASGIKKLVDTQYGTASFRFDFGLPDASIFMKQGRLHVDDGAGETLAEGKGTGMQRAIALAIIQHYARSAELLDGENKTPLVLILDEPETWLHPSAQLRLGDALSSIGEREQVFVITHSPYLIRKFDSERHLLTVLSGQGDDRKVDPSTKFGLFGMGEPTWGEINYRAFEVCSNDFHNELYGHVQRHLDAQKPEGKFAKEQEIDQFLESQGIGKSKTWIRSESLRYSSTLPVYIRNSIHHPENNMNQPFTQEELLASTKQLVGVVEAIKAAAV